MLLQAVARRAYFDAVMWGKQYYKCKAKLAKKFDVRVYGDMVSAKGRANSALNWFAFGDFCLWYSAEFGEYMVEQALKDIKDNRRKWYGSIQDF